MNELIRVEVVNGVRVVALDDGKVNVMSLAMLRAIDAELASGASQGQALVITSRARVFSAGFDMGALREGAAAAAMLAAGARLTQRLLEYPAPLVAAVSGSAIAMGAFVALGADLRLASDDAKLKIIANEVAIGLTLPRFATALLRHRLTPADFDRATLTARPYTAEQAVAAGWFCERLPADTLLPQAIDRAAQLAALDRTAFTATKLRVREQVLTELRAGVAADVADWQARAAQG